MLLLYLQKLHCWCVLASCLEGLWIMKWSCSDVLPSCLVRWMTVSDLQCWISRFIICCFEGRVQSFGGCYQGKGDISCGWSSGNATASRNSFIVKWKETICSEQMVWIIWRWQLVTRSQLIGRHQDGWRLLQWLVSTLIYPLKNLGTHYHHLLLWLMEFDARENNCECRI